MEGGFVIKVVLSKSFICCTELKQRAMVVSGRAARRIDGETGASDSFASAQLVDVCLRRKKLHAGTNVNGL